MIIFQPVAAKILIVDNSHLRMNSPEILIVIVGSVGTKLYDI